MIQEHPITPPPELIQHWLGNYFGCIVSGGLSPSENFLATQAALWGADQELDACCSWVSQFDYDDYSYGDRLRAARRGRTIPPSLKEQALIVLEDASDRLDAAHENILRRALESLPE